MVFVQIDPLGYIKRNYGRRIQGRLKPRDWPGGKESGSNNKELILCYSTEAGMEFELRDNEG